MSLCVVLTAAFSLRLVFFPLPQLHWLYWGYSVEFLGLSSFTGMWLAGLLFFAANMAVLGGVLAHHRFVPVFQGGARTSIGSDGAAGSGSAAAAPTTLTQRTKDQ